MRNSVNKNQTYINILIVDSINIISKENGSMLLEHHEPTTSKLYTTTFKSSLTWLILGAIFE
jgi:hypothetical protein